MADAERMREQLQTDRPTTTVATPVIAPPTGAGTADVIADGGDRIELDLAAFTTAVADLDRLHGVVTDLLGRAARESEQPLGDGKGPVSLNMRHAFGVRSGDVGGGVRSALRSYLAELGALREALQQVSTTHQAEDEHTARAMGQL
ncbi:hypothetical protein [Umezawaea tangerina]|uniref:hypothetical protein n=1 Tax=Umezawaea tangerina TaxID=84725 RepID=UPI0011B1F7BF|nr:hypothetical protein [Umezawaea tangerina]